LTPSPDTEAFHLVLVVPLTPLWILPSLPLQEQDNAYYPNHCPYHTHFFNFWAAQLVSGRIIYSETTATTEPPATQLGTRRIRAGQTSAPKRGERWSAW